MFAIMFPLLIMFYSVAYDGARFQSSRARLADGLNQGVLAVAMVDNRNATSADETANITLLHSYLSYYLPDATISKNDLKITVAMNYSTSGKVESVDYTGSGKASVQPIIGAQREVGFDSSLDLRADSSAGVVRRTIEEVEYPTDYALVLDFSGSMLSASAEPGLTRIALLRKVVTEFMDEILSDESSNTVGIIPFTSGVSVILPGENIAGGNNFGCSHVGKLKSEYAGVDLNFWYNKKLYYYSSSLPAQTSQYYQLDQSLYNYYKNVVSPATGYSMDDMVNKSWCVKNPRYGESYGRALYSCDADSRANLFDNYTEFLETRSAAQKLMYYAYYYLTMFNTVTMDFDGLLADGFMFSDKAVTTYNYMVNLIAERPFYYDCYSTFGSITAATASNTLKSKTAKPASYLIELTNDRSIIDEFNDMQVTGGATYVTSGLLRALPVIAKGVNQRKVIIVISDGLDSDNGTLAKKLFDDYSLCDKIKEGLLRYPEGTPTEQADMFFIFTVNSSASTTALNLWSNYCVGKENVYLATNYQDMINVLTGIAKNSSVKFINKNEQE
ncbi:hypothetical protein AWC35_07935 [Gibbsiella quercinecans]|uniref:VWFA domain-containing protein n=2 Tax=Gibbsiella quercinecans TaxID=929813 RepID=A0A250AZ74_9GAMM|nr:hypothetical protein AWC35_07935 [Gibbsiella quercinecans]RLM11101.1 hypothetical protein BIY30_09135 [Gibbsiella quercinecans]